MNDCSEMHMVIGVPKCARYEMLREPRGQTERLIPLSHPARLSGRPFLEAQTSHLLPRDSILSSRFEVFISTPPPGRP